MALVKRFERLGLQKNVVHGEAACTFTVFADDAGVKYFQLDTYGSAARKFPGKKSQTMQFDEKTARELARLINDAFGR